MESRRATLVDDISRQTGITDAMISDLVAARDAPYGSSSVSQ